MGSRAVAWLAMACTACTQLLGFDELSSHAADRSGPRDAGIDASDGEVGDDAGDAAMALPVFEIGIIDMSPDTVAPWVVRFDNFMLEIEER
jgi:hypothetical protein